MKFHFIPTKKTHNTIQLPLQLQLNQFYVHTIKRQMVNLHDHNRQIKRNGNAKTRSVSVLPLPTKRNYFTFILMTQYDCVPNSFTEIIL